MKISDKLLITSIFIFVLIVFIPWLSVTESYLGYYPDDNITIAGSKEWKDWHEIKINESECFEKKILNTYDCCGGHVTTYCKRVWNYAYFWCVSYSFDDKCYWQWWFEK